MVVEQASCDYEDCTAEGTAEDYDHQWWCALHWWMHADGNDDSLYCLNLEMDEAINRLDAAMQDYMKIYARFKASKKIIEKLEVDNHVAME